MSKEKSYLEKILMDVDGQPSSKRLITLISFLLITIAFVANIFIELPLKEYMFEGMLWLAGAGLGFATAEKFSRKSGVSGDEYYDSQNNGYDSYGGPSDNEGYGSHSPHYHSHNQQHVDHNQYHNSEEHGHSTELHKNTRPAYGDAHFEDPSSDIENNNEDDDSDTYGGPYS